MNATTKASTLIAALAFATGCDPAASDSTENVRPAPTLAVPATPAADERLDLAVTGQLADVDLNVSMFRLLFADGSRMTFQYTEDTDIIGTGGMQGLGAQEGTRATVRYDNHTMPPTVVSIEVVESAIPGP